MTGRIGWCVGSVMFHGLLVGRRVCRGMLVGVESQIPKTLTQLFVFPANALVEKQRAQLVDQHKSGCPWKTKQCDGMFFIL